MSIIATINVAAGDDLYRVAAELYGDASAAALLLRANNLVDPIIQVDQVLLVPNYDILRANGGILRSQNNPTTTTSF